MNTIIEKIRAEVNRRIKELDEQIVDIYDSKAVLRKDELQKLLSRLSDLEKSEKPTNLVCEELDAYAQKVEDYYDVGEERGYLCTHRGDIKNAVLAGAKWQKEQMLKEAVKGEVFSVVPNRGAVWYVASYPDVMPLRNRGDRVRIIILPKEDYTNIK